MKTLFEYKNQDPCFRPLRLIIAGTAGCGKTYLIKCLVRTIKITFNSNNYVQVLCPTRNSSNLISGVTIHSFLKIPTFSKSKEIKVQMEQQARTCRKSVKVSIFF